MNLASFRLDSLVIHDVPQPSDDPDEMILTDAEVPLDNQLRRYFQRKISESLTHRGLEVLADPTGSAVVRTGVASILADHAQLVPVSQTIAGHLDASQTRRNPAGLLAVGLGTVEEGEVVAVLKLEREQGLRLRIAIVEDHTQVDLEYLRDLTLTDKTKIFKTSLLCLDDARPESLYGRVSDDQRGRDEGAGVATFFLATFLGCGLKTNPEKATRDFVLAFEEFINQHVTSDERRADYHIALLAKMQDQSLDLRPREFADLNLDPLDRSSFLGCVAQRGLDPDQVFEKDTSRSKVNGFKMVFNHGMTLVGSTEDLRERVHMRVEGGSTSGVLIEDILKRLGGR